MKMLSMEPDEHMRWIYDSTHPNYDREHAEYLRARRAAAIRSAPRWMVEEARLNDIQREQTPNAELRGASRLHGEASLSNDVLGNGGK